MASFKCKMCGGTLEIIDKQTVAVCEYCQTKQTLPRLDDERRVQMYNRAGHFRRNNEFDKAAGIYEQILNEDDTDAEAYWSLVLCRYGIEYVEDPVSLKRIPTVNRTQFTSVFDDENYKQALNYADIAQKVLFEEEARRINEIQKEILKISQSEEAFDIFICYKETDDDGKRTKDSVLANELYYQLVQEGYKVFFSRITLEDKLGTAYEPYIFAALNSAKVMIVLGTRAEYFNAAWVKNEWSRYLSLIKQGEKKILIPAYRDMDPYDLPEEFSHLQAQDMSKLGFMQDLVRGIKKLAGAGGSRSSDGKPDNLSKISPMISRIFIYAEDCNWEKAEEYCNRVISEAPNEALAYLGKLMIERKCCNREDLRNSVMPLEDSVNYQKIISLGNRAVTNEVVGYNAVIKERINREAAEARRQEEEREERQRKDGIYKKAKGLLDSKDEKNLEEAISLLKSIGDWKDASRLSKELEERLSVIKTYSAYVSEYPLIKEKEKLDVVRKKLIQMLKDTRFGKSGFPVYISLLPFLSIICLLNGFLKLGDLRYTLFPLKCIVTGIIIALIFVYFYISKICIKRAGLAMAILEYEEKMKLFAEIPSFYSYAPEMLKYKAFSDEYIAEKERGTLSKAVEEWEDKTDALLKQRESEKQARFCEADEEYEALIANLGNQKIMIQDKYAQEKSQLARERESKESRYNTLNIFQIGEKKEIKDRLQQIETRLAVLPNESDIELQKIQRQINAAHNELKRQKKAIEREIEAKFPIPLSPEDDPNMSMMNVAIEEAERKQKEEREKLKEKNKDHRIFVVKTIKKYMKIDV